MNIRVGSRKRCFVGKHTIDFGSELEEVFKKLTAKQAKEEKLRKASIKAVIGLLGRPYGTGGGVQHGKLS